MEHVSLGISVIVPNYNHAKYLPESLDSILNQTRPPDEIIVIDDASTDGSISVIEAYQKKNPRIRLIRHKSNQGVFATANEGLQLARYKYVGLLAADDILFPHFFSEALKLFQKAPDLGLVCGDLSFFQDAKPYLYEGYHFLPLASPQIFSPDETVRFLRETEFRVESTASLYNLECIKKYGCFQICLKSLSDHYLNYQIALRHPIGYVPKIQAAFRRMPGSYGTLISKDINAKNELFSNFFGKLEKEDLSFRKQFKKSNSLAKCGFFVIYFAMMRLRYWSYLPTLCMKKAPYLMIRIWHRLRKTKYPLFPLKPTYFSAIEEIH